MTIMNPTRPVAANDNADGATDFVLALASLADLLAEACIREIEAATNDNRTPAAEA
jgi:hypothetical protein